MLKGKLDFSASGNQVTKTLLAYDTDYEKIVYHKNHFVFLVSLQFLFSSKTNCENKLKAKKKLWKQINSSFPVCRNYKDSKRTQSW